MKKITSVARIKDPYTKRILSYIIGKDAFNIYCQTPSRLKHLVKGLNEKQLRTPPSKGKWSIAQIVAHLCDSELVMGYRYRMAIAQSGCKIQAFNQEQWAKNLRYESSDVNLKLDLFTKMRNDNVALLRSLTANEWKSYGIHEERGKETVERMMQLEAGHDVNHLRQIQNIRKTFLR
jgi:hypothetical protein